MLAFLATFKTNHNKNKLVKRATRLNKLINRVIELIRSGIIKMD